MKNTAIKLCNETIYPGEILSLALPSPQLFSCAPLHIPIKVIHGKQSGPCLLLTAAMHGNEINGTEIIHRLLNLPMISRLRGTLIAVPILNVYGFINRDRYLPGGVDLNRSFPGAKNGSMAERIAHLFSTEILSRSNYCIDLQTGPLNCSNLPQVYANFNDKQSLELAKAFNTPIILNAVPEAGSLQSLATEKHIPFLMYEAGEAMRFDEHAITTGLEGIINVMRKLEMLPEKNRQEKSFKSLLAQTSVWICSSSSGVSHSKHKLGQHVQKGDTLSVIKDPFGASENVTLFSPNEGVIVGKNNLPLVHEGEALFQLAVFPEMNHAANHLEAWHVNSTQR
ncbi:succinylglutamate desuccinylase/aspartoacylase family protein [Aquicella lusitana]|uniref:Succinylglutamate desuccinylase/Aspartoacylase catalytic domain-containing protein n=1 Tax=Aquicella lusitana TaxID=254246 RepID=A0A370GLI1_9COXI|nr:succinylglutamate desuccinylase/aspartoacylase family protein [Aquicella lusitana]RDI44531.1 hypothetical protein C8D86_10913 [Aquicella lusitana]VVC72527.1 N-alpha-acetyl-L-2,4-diaminobutyric acid deacetylase [Aquicella lusitana]